MKGISIHKRSKKLTYKEAYFYLRRVGFTLRETRYSMDKGSPSEIENVMYRTVYPIKEGRNNKRTFYKHLQKLAKSERWEKAKKSFAGG